MQEFTDVRSPATSGMVMTGSNPQLTGGMRDIVAQQIANRAGSVQRWGLLELL